MKLIIDIDRNFYEMVKYKVGSKQYNYDQCWKSIANGVPYEKREKGTLEKIRAEIREEAEFAYADFEKYKVECLGIEGEYVEDELPDDDFRYGMERAIEIINKNTVAIPEREKGEWILDDGINAVCPICNKLNGARGDFCKWCGSDLRGEYEEETC